jgi:hypothetical protein
MPAHASPEVGDYRVSKRCEVAESDGHRRPLLRVFVDRRQQCIIGVLLTVNASNVTTCRSCFPRPDWVGRRLIACR